MRPPTVRPAKPDLLQALMGRVPLNLITGWFVHAKPRGDIDAVIDLGTIGESLSRKLGGVGLPNPDCAQTCTPHRQYLIFSSQPEEP
ncbi:UNVERIFIED_CONTAM: hypothetical protein PYX00_001612 [Menopon gallinae]|uniref:Uncharacterized protein n=1 Tax=Menopon gallinae TaxID=328185 RepID=A0AAW2ID17_9NEOP